MVLRNKQLYVLSKAILEKNITIQETIFTGMPGYDVSELYKMMHFSNIHEMTTDDIEVDSLIIFTQDAHLGSPLRHLIRK